MVLGSLYFYFSSAHGGVGDQLNGIAGWGLSHELLLLTYLGIGTEIQEFPFLCVMYFLQYAF